MLAVEDGKRYAKLHRIGEGSFGQVFRATDTRTGRDVALKHIRLRGRSQPAISGSRGLHNSARLSNRNDN